MTRGNTVAWPWPVFCTFSVSRSVPSPGNESSALSIGAAAGMFQHAADAEAAIFAALSATLAAAGFEAVVIGELERLVEHRFEIAAVVGGADRGLVRHRRFFDEIAPAQL